MDASAAQAAASLFSSQVGAALISAYAIQRLKTWKAFPLLQEGAKVASRLASIGVAGAFTIGITLQWNHMQGGGYSFAGTIPPWNVMLIHLWHWGCQFAFNEGAYQNFWNKMPAAGVKP